MKRGRKKGVPSKRCKLMFCLKCGDFITSSNASGYRRSGPYKDRPLNMCKQCNQDLQIIKRWRVRTLEEIEARISWHADHIHLLLSAKREKANRS